MNSACPNCGWEDPLDWVGSERTEAPTLMERKNARTYLQDGEFTACEWTEVHKCPDCGTIFEFDDADA